MKAVPGKPHEVQADFGLRIPAVGPAAPAIFRAKGVCRQNAPILDT
jgi:hypothetical protein